jgi:nucleoside-diphosphate-sugar epimerase
VKALVVGGSGASGPLIVRGLIERDYEVTVLGRGVHPPAVPDSVLQVQADPFELDSLQAALAAQSYDLVIAMYGVLRHVATACMGVTSRFISVGGLAPIYKGWGEMTSINPWETTSSTPLFLEEEHALAREEGIDRFAGAVRKAEGFVMQAHSDRHFNATHFRYPLVYGPGNICPAEWGLIRRAREGRRPLILPGGGLTLVARGFSENMAHAILLAVEQPDASAGQIYNICDARPQYNAEWVQTVSRFCGHEFETVPIPFDLLPPGFRATPPQLLYRHHWVPSTQKVMDQLGYRDLVDFEEAIEQTVRWYHDHPLEAGAEEERNLGDPFDYAYEDAVIAAYRQLAGDFSEQISVLPHEEVQWRHPYQKPQAER